MYRALYAAESGASGDGEDRLLVDRLRLCAKLILAGVAIVFAGELLLYSGRPYINLVQAINFAACAGALAVLRNPERRSFNLAVGFTAYVITIVSTATVGILASDATTPVIIMVGTSVVAAVLIPWHPAWQVASVVLIAATAMWTVATVMPSPHLFWLQNVGAIAPTLAATVVISHVLRRQRAAVAHAEREWRMREESLREANRRLEHEINEHRRTEGALRFAMRELDHRVKNTLATVQAVADQTLRASQSMSEFGPAFSGRIQAMARIHTALAGRRWEGLSLAELIELVVGPYRRHADSVSVDCDGTSISSEVVRVLGIVLHELTTNAAKYGALSSDEGRLAISSHLDSLGTRLLRISWTEHGGPPISEPAPRGVGVRLIEEALAYEFDGRVQLHFRGEGLHCEIQIPVQLQRQ